MTDPRPAPRVTAGPVSGVPIGTPSGDAPSLGRRVAAEAVGTGLLVAAVIGSGIAAARLSPSDEGLQLLENGIATGAVLVALVLALQPVSAAFNPVVTMVERATGAITTSEAIALMASQVLGGAAGAMLANVMFDLPVVTISSQARGSAGQSVGEVVATFGLVVLVISTQRAGRAHAIAYVVGGWITAAYWFTSSTSFANPAVTIARTLSDTFAGIAVASVPVFVLMQLLGGALALGFLAILHPSAKELRP